MHDDRAELINKEKYRNVSQFLAGCERFLDLQQAVVNHDPITILTAAPSRELNFE